ncbi:hypothetical protein [Zavarzinia sp.]|uniref:hypothetical protein n=1 Tax=Zavarzinia sp. TaxID=2027920 RepID=UPI0035628109
MAAAARDVEQDGAALRVALLDRASKMGSDRHATRTLRAGDGAQNGAVQRWSPSLDERRRRHRDGCRGASNNAMKLTGLRSSSEEGFA